MAVRSDWTSRVIEVEIQDGPDLEAGWATWRTKPRPFQLENIRVTLDGLDFRAAVIAGHIRKKDGTLSESVNDSVSLHQRDLDALPEEQRWLRTLVQDVIGNVKGATYPTPESTKIMGGYSG